MITAVRPALSSVPLVGKTVAHVQCQTLRRRLHKEQASLFMLSPVLK